MKLPLFAHLRMVKNCRVPDEVRHSPILSAQWRWENGLPSYERWTPTFDGVSIIDAIVTRIFRNSGPVRSQEIAAVRERLADRIYSKTQAHLYRRRHVLDLRSGCFVKKEVELNFDPDPDQRLYVRGDRAWTHRIEPIRVPVEVAKQVPCKFCRRPVFYSEKWKSFNRYMVMQRHLHCDSQTCRHMAHLENVPAKKGGIQLTPTQRKNPISLWPLLLTANYLNLKSKEMKNGKRQHLGR